MRTSIAVALSLLLSACSVFNAPDPRRLDAYVPDGGIDGSNDAGHDAGNDAGNDASVDGGSCMSSATTEAMCDDGEDDDCDGLVDCADPDCVLAHAAACCMAGGSTVIEHFDKSGATWTTAGNWSSPDDIAGAISLAGKLIEMGTGPTIGMVNNACLRVDLGAEIRFTMTAQPCTGSECDGSMEVVIGPSSTFTGMLTDDVAIRGHADATMGLLLEVVQGGTVRRTSMPFGTAVTTVDVTLSPGLANGRPAIVATVTASSGTNSETLADQLYVTDRDIFGTSSCHGLHLGVQGVGDHVALDDVQISQLDCANPARFDALRDDADAVDAVTASVSSADHTMGWGRGGIGDPALFEGALAGSSTHRFVLLYDGSPVDRASDVIGHLPLSIGGVDTTATGSTSTDLAIIDDCSRWIPRAGAIACTPPAMATGHDVVESALVMRDPTLYPDNRDPLNISTFRVAWVGETAPGSSLALYTTSLDAIVSGRIGAVPAPTTIDLEDAIACPSIRNPLLLPLLGTTSDWLLFYVCDTFPPVVHAARLVGGTATRLDGVELGPMQLGALAQEGVTDIAGVVYDYVQGTGPGATHTPTYRLWLTARPTTTQTSVLYVEGRPAYGVAPTAADFVPYPGNPVLTASSTVFGSCALGCQLHGITATRISNQPTRVRLLIERWVDTGSGLTYGLVPLEQVWPADP